MANTKKPGQQNSKVFPIVITLVALGMVAIVAVTVASNKKPSGKKGKIEVASAVKAQAATVNGNQGSESLPALPTDGSADPAIGMMVPTITAQNFNGDEVTITPGTKPYVVAFIAHWCPHCQREVPLIVGLNDDGKLPKDVEFIGVSTSVDETRGNYPPSKWLSKEQWPWRTIADDQSSTLLEAFGGSGFPYLVYVNADGTVQARTSGEQKEETIIANAQAISESK